MNNPDQYLITVNCGSSSIKLSIYMLNISHDKILNISIENIGLPNSKIIVNRKSMLTPTENNNEAQQILCKILKNNFDSTKCIAFGHRIVHGGPNFYNSIVADDDNINELKKLVPYDPLHLPSEISFLELLKNEFPSSRQILCFDTSFHHDLPLVSRLLPIPRILSKKGIRKYGFHGLSYSYIMDELRRVEGETAANGKVIIAHLGSGVSLVGLKEGRPIDTTMSFTPASGVPMSTRSGDLDPGLIRYLSETENYSIDNFNRMINEQSGLLGISEISSDMKKLIDIESEDSRAKDAIDIFCYNVRKSIGALSAALGGLNTLVFTGGMGENSPVIRNRICSGLEFLGISIDNDRNEKAMRLISSDSSSVGVHKIDTDESATIVKEIIKIINIKEKI